MAVLIGHRMQASLAGTGKYTTVRNQSVPPMRVSMRKSNEELCEFIIFILMSCDNYLCYEFCQQNYRERENICIFEDYL